MNDLKQSVFMLLYCDGKPHLYGSTGKSVTLSTADAYRELQCGRCGQIAWEHILYLRPTGNIVAGEISYPPPEIDRDASRPIGAVIYCNAPRQPIVNLRVVGHIDDIVDVESMLED